MRRSSRRFLVLAAAMLALVPVGVQVPTRAVAAQTEVEPLRLSPGMVEALARDLGMSEAEASRTLRAQSVASAEIAPRLRAVLGERFGGAWWDDTTGRLAVGVRGAGLEQTVRAAGARPVVVARSQRQLHQALTALDRPTPPDGVTNWYVDLPGNAVVVEALPQAQAAARAFVAAAGLDPATVQVVSSASRPRPDSDLLGGNRFNIGGGYCSIGFAVNGGYVTAGHCVSPGAPTTSALGEPLGVAQAGVYPGNDYGWVQTYANWIPRPLVDAYYGNRYYVDNATEMVVNAAVCRSGARTGWNCGKITAKNVTVNYGEGKVYRLTKTNVCSEGGDSGGPYLSGTSAQGVTSGSESGEGCPGHERSYFQPVQPILNAYGLTLSTTATPPPAGSPPVMTGLQCYADSGSYSCQGSYYGGVEPVTLEYSPGQTGQCDTYEYQYVYAAAVDAAGQRSTNAERGFPCPYSEGPLLR